MVTSRRVDSTTSSVVDTVTDRSLDVGEQVEEVSVSAVFEILVEQGESFTLSAETDASDSFLTAQVFDLAGYAVTAPAVFQTLPSLGEPDDEVIDLSSQDVRDLFVDGLPETVDEAVRQLEDAGLLGEVIAVLDENDLAGDALLRGSGASPGPAEVSVDVGQGIPGRYLVLVTSIDRERPIRVRLDAA